MAQKPWVLDVIPTPKTDLKSHLLHLMRPHYVRELVPLQKVEQGVAAEEVGRASPCVEHKAIIAVQFHLHLIRDHVRAAHTENEIIQQLGACGGGGGGGLMCQ